jgi:hypothetical protein
MGRRLVGSLVLGVALAMPSAEFEYGGAEQADRISAVSGFRQGTAGYVDGSSACQSKGFSRLLALRGSAASIDAGA